MSPPDPHPAFANPSIHEALCELHFTLPEGRIWNPQWFGDLFTRAEEYPRMVPSEIVEIGAGILPDGVVQQVRKLGVRTAYHHLDRPHLIQLSDTTFTVNELAPYPGWAVFQGDIESGWGLLADTVEPSGLSRIGLRYINRIPRANREEPVSEWIASTEFVPERVRSARSRFHSRLQLRISEEQRLVVTIAELEEEGRTWIMLDIDTVLFASVAAEWPRIQEQTNLLHETIWSVFSDCMTDRLRAYLQEVAHADNG